MSQTLVLTLHMDGAAQSFYDDLRRRYFPPERNLVSAHLTLFHQLSDEENTHQALREAAKEAQVFQLAQPQLRSIGKGVAVFFQSQELAALHVALSRVFETRLIAQDRQRLRPHIVVQNKVEPATARQTLVELQGSRLPEPHGIGLSLWRYLGGPWEHVSNFPFAE